MREADVTQDAEVVALLAELVAIDSVNPGLVPGAAGEARIVDHLQARLRRSGFTTTVVGPADRPSLIAVPAEAQDGGAEDGGAETGGGSSIGTGTRPTVVLNGHLDTVGVAGMPEPFTPRVDGDRMTGRGTVDMKGGVAALVVAAERLVASGPGCGRCSPWSPTRRTPASAARP